MNCPKCESSVLVEYRVKKTGTRVDRCPSCKGLWFDDGELAEVIGVPSAGRLKVPEGTVAQPQVRCPRCSEPLRLFCYPGTMTLIDMCSGCGGVWLDEHELQEIARSAEARKTAAQSAPASVAAPDPVQTQTCPKCGHVQPKADECAACGIVFAKYRAARERQKTETRATATRRAEQRDTHHSYADDIPGIKGTLLRKIDRGIEVFTNF
jgi:Zn-finger nucleic acid-binding protein